MSINEDDIERLVVGLFGNDITTGMIEVYKEGVDPLTTRDIDEIIDYGPEYISLLTKSDELVGFVKPVTDTPEYFPSPTFIDQEDYNVWLFNEAATSNFLIDGDLTDISVANHIVSDNFYDVEDFDEPEISDTSKQEISETSVGKIDQSKPITIAMGSTAMSGKGKWNNATATVKDFIAMTTNHEVGSKDGTCFLQGEIAGNGRSAIALIRNHVIGLDLDTGDTAEEVDQRLGETGLGYVRYTTHSHLKTETEIKRNSFFKWSGTDAKRDSNVQQLKVYLKEVKGFIPRILENLEIVEEARVTDKGTMIVVRHQPMPKHRVIFFLNEPFVFQGKVNSDEEKRAWKEHYHGFGTELGFVYDNSCLDPARLFYLPRHDKDQEFETKFVDGDYVDLRSYARLVMKRDTETQSLNPYQNAANSLGVSDSGDKMYVNDFNLKRWIVTHDCEIVSLIDEHYPDAIKSIRTNGPGFHIECPFEEEHSTVGGLGTFAVNASDNDKGFHIHCVHDSCQGRNKLEYVKKMVELEWFTTDDLMDETYCPSLIVEEKREDIPLDDKIDVEKVIGSLDKLSSKDQAIDVLRQIGKDKTISKDEYDDIIGRIARKTKLKKRELQKFAPQTFKNDEETMNRIVTDVEKKLMDYNKRYAMVDTGSKVVIVDFNKSELTFMNRDDWKALKVNEKITTSTGHDETKMEYVTKLWTEWSQRRTYEGVGFDPRPVPNPNILNLYDGLKLVPRKGDWSCLKNHIFNVLCHGDEREFMWLMTWLAQLFQQPWKKMGTALVIRGEKGAGKSLVFKYVKDILGKYAMATANPSHITGNFNWHFRDKLLLIAEEGLFAGSAKDDSILKELITGETLTMEPKGIDAFQMENFVRIVIISNEEWVINATPDERRYYVTEASSSMIGNNPYFDAIMDQMNSGGREAMLYDLLNFDPTEVFKEGWNILRQPPKTTALSKQVGRSMPPWEKFFINLIENLGVEEADSNIEPIILELDASATVKEADLRYYYNNSLKTNAGRHKQSPEVFKELLKKYIPNFKYRRTNGYGKAGEKMIVIPAIEDVIPHVEQNLKIKLNIIEYEND